MAARKLQTEIDRVLKKVSEGVEEFDSIWEKVYSASNLNQKEKYEGDLKKEIKKLQRLRDQVKTWLSSADIKDKSQLLETRRLIETKMEAFKVCEKETKTKAYSTEALAATSKTDPRYKAKSNTRQWTSAFVSRLEEQVQEAENEIEGLAARRGKGGKDAQRQTELEEMIERHKHHIDQLELIQRLCDSDKLDPLAADEIKDSVECYIDNSQDPDFYQDDTIYDSLNLDSIDMSTDIPPPPADRTSPLLPVNSTPFTPVGAAPAVPAAATPKADAKPAAAPAPAPPAAPTSVVKPEAKRPETVAPTRPAVVPTVAAKAAPVPDAAKAASPKAPTPKVPPAPIAKAPAPVAAAVVAPPKAAPAKAPEPKAKRKLDVATPSPPTVPAAAPTPAAPAAPTTPAAAPAQPPALARPRPVLDVPTTPATPIVPAAPAPAPSLSPPRGQGRASGPIKATTAPVKAPPPSPGRGAGITPVGGAVEARAAMPPIASPSFGMSPMDELVGFPTSRGARPVESRLVRANGKSEDASAGLGVGFGSGASTPSLTPAAGDFLLRPGSASADLLADEAVGPDDPVMEEDTLRLLRLLESSHQCMPESDDRTGRQYNPQTPAPTAPYYPQSVIPLFDNPALYERLDTDTLFFIFYYQQGTYQQFLAARELKKQSWRFHKKYLTWFQRHEEPKVITDEYEEGTYVYFDYESGWCQRKKTEFTFEYRFLEDEPL